MRLLICFSILFSFACGQSSVSSPLPSSVESDTLLALPTSTSTGNHIHSRFAVPRGYERIVHDSSSFPFFLRHLPLKPVGAEVLYYNGKKKANYDVYEAVIDLPIGKRDLHQCADAVMRLRADYLLSVGREDEISFKFMNGMKVPYSRWQSGDRIKFNGNQTDWKIKSGAENAENNYWKYLEIIFAYAGTASLEKELTEKPLHDIDIGDVFIQGGSPGHAVIIVDMAEDNNGKKVFLLAQSYMPAQELQILRNPNNSNLSPWYDASETDRLITPEWTFEKGALRSF